MLRRLAAAAWLFAAAAAGAQTCPSLQFQPLQKAPVIDGQISDAEWAGASRVDAVFQDSSTGAPLGDPVTFRIASYSGVVYFAVQVIDDPATLQDSEFRANVSLDLNDSIILSIDPFARGSSFSSFAVNPAGANSISIAGGRAPKAEWAGSLRTAGRRTPTGWQAEMAIPWALMDLPPAGSHDVMFNVKWNERTTLRPRLWHFNNGHSADTPLWKSVPIPSVSSRPVLRLLPYLYGGAQEKAGDPIINGGLDFKSSLTSRSQLVGAINPDFRNIENSILSLDFSYFERLAGESRPFFLEGSGYREEADPLFASQRISSFDAGVNTYGSLDDKSNYSLLATSDLGRQTAVVGTYSRSLSSYSGLTASYVGSLEKDLNSHAGMLRFSQRSGIWNSWAMAAATTDDVEGSGSAASFGTGMSSAGFYANAEYDGISTRFFPRLGYMPETGFRQVSVNSGWTRPHPRGCVMESGVDAGLQYAETLSGEVYKREANISGSITYRDLADLDFGTTQEYFQNNVDQNWWVSLEKPRGNLYRSWEVHASGGMTAGRRFTARGFRFSHRPWKRVQTTLTTQWLDHFESQRQIIFSFNWEKGLFESFGGRLVEQDGHINWHLSWRRSGGLGAEYYVILGDPSAQSFRKQIIIKAVFPLSVPL